MRLQFLTNPLKRIPILSLCSTISTCVFLTLRQLEKLRYGVSIWGEL